MTITRETVEHVARLARLELSTEETERYTQDMSNILGLVEQLNQLDLSNVQVDLQVNEATVYRPDAGIREFTREELLANAPQEEDGFFRVPRILED